MKTEEERRVEYLGACEELRETVLGGTFTSLYSAAKAAGDDKATAALARGFVDRIIEGPGDWHPDESIPNFVWSALDLEIGVLTAQFYRKRKEVANA